MSDSPFADLRGLPYYDEPTLLPEHGRPALGLGVRRLEAREHVLEDRLLHPHRPVEHTARSSAGPDVKEFFSSIAVNSFENFPIGSMKHSIYCNDDGLITAHAILQRNDEDEYRYFAGLPVAALQAA